MPSNSDDDRFTLKHGKWVAMDLWMEGADAVHEHSSPIRIDRIVPLGTGRSEVELGFFHACYPDGVQDKVYRLRILHRSEHQILAVQLDDHNRTLRLAPISRAWLSRQCYTPVLVTMAADASDDFGAQLDRWVAGDNPPEVRVPFAMPWELEETIMHCALRFDGYAWLDAHPDRREENNPVLPDDRLRELLLDSDVEVNFTAFFMLQRFLGKWGGETLSPSDKHHTAFRFLFLHLYSHPTPTRWVYQEYETKWLNIPPDRVAAAASAVRRVLLAADLRPSSSTGQ